MYFRSLCSSGVSEGAEPKPGATAEKQPLAGFIIAADSGKCSPDIDSSRAPVSPRDVQETQRVEGNDTRFGYRGMKTTPVC